ncbi:hypothetical protein LTR64_003820 [Lithohypha guttulata]|uniref:uncharacterized protein n=1 Tax=Lithohypha guttulata TaxID=1690604 RepID=UPI002DDEBFAB|nr:hypothetical protein LTR51_006858 [Lithohypha guttulata]
MPPHVTFADTTISSSSTLASEPTQSTALTTPASSLAWLDVACPRLTRPIRIPLPLPHKRRFNHPEPPFGWADADAEHRRYDAAKTRRNATTTITTSPTSSTSSSASTSISSLVTAPQCLNSNPNPSTRHVTFAPSTLDLARAQKRRRERLLDAMGFPPLSRSPLPPERNILDPRSIFGNMFEIAEKFASEEAEFLQKQQEEQYDDYSYPTWQHFEDARVMLTTDYASSRSNSADENDFDNPYEPEVWETPSQREARIQWQLRVLGRR